MGKLVQMQIELGDALMAEVDLHHAVSLQVWTQGHGITAKSCAHAIDLTAVVKLAFALHTTQRQAFGVVQCRQVLRKDARTGSITAARWLQVQPLMWALEVVDRTPQIEALLGMRQIAQRLKANDLGVQGAMEALILAHRLGVVGTRMAQPNAQADEPHAQSGVGVCVAVAPRPAVVGDDPLGHAVAAHGLGQCLLHAQPLLVGQSLQTHIKARVIVQHSERMAALLTQQREMALEVHLPKRIGLLALEALKGRVFSRLFRVNEPMAQQHCVYGAAIRNVAVALGKQARTNGSRAPSPMVLSHAHDQVLHPHGYASGRVLGPARAIGKPSSALSSKARYPLVPSRAADLKAAAQLALVGSLLQRQSHKLLTLRHDRHLFPWHGRPPIEQRPNSLPM